MTLRRNLILLLAAISYPVSSALSTTGHFVGRGGIQCVLEKVSDSQRTGMVAFTYMVPKGWKPQSSMNWNGKTFVADLSAATPDKAYIVDHIEPFNLTYNSSTGTQTTGYKVSHATDFLHALLNRMLQQGTVSNVQVVSEFNKSLPLTEMQEKMQQSRQIGGMSQNVFHETGFLKVTFERNGIQETANLGTTVQGSNQSNNMKIGIGPTSRGFDSENGIYVIGPTLGVTAPTKPDPRRVQEARIVASSPHITAGFELYCAKLALAMSQAGLEATRERGQQMIRDMRANREKMMNDFRHQMAEKDLQTHDYCNYLSDRADYKNKDGSILTLPNYRYVYQNSDGNYLLSDDPKFDPNSTGDHTWDQMQSVVHGGH